MKFCWMILAPLGVLARISPYPRGRRAPFLLAKTQKKERLILAALESPSQKKTCFFGLDLVALRYREGSVPTFRASIPLKGLALSEAFG
jgi:hypothetical protein